VTSSARNREHYDLLETFRQLGYLVEYFGFDRRHPAIKRAKNFVSRYQCRLFKRFYGA
jgi:hypothetical protein